MEAVGCKIDVLNEMSWIALKGKPLELIICRCHLFWVVVVLDYLLSCEEVPSPIGLRDSDGVTTVVDDGTCNEGERTVGGGMEMMRRLIRK